MLNQVRWHQANAEANPLEHLNLIRRFVHWRNGRQMDIYIGKELDKRYNEYKSGPNTENTKAVINLVLHAYLANDTKVRPERLDPVFRAFAISQIRLFVFLGHDSTSSTICYILHLLSTNPSALAQLRTEHDQYFGTDLDAVPAMLKGQPHLANDLPYTTAVIKESLRLFPPGGASRQGKAGAELIDDQGHCCPTENTMIFTIHTEMHRAPAYWKQPDDFVPERWLIPDTRTEDKLLPLKGAYRAFEIGPRNCIAQGFVMTELRVILTLLVRRFDFAPAYDEWDRLHSRKGARYRGERAYQIEEGAAHPVDKYPCRVSERGS